ncbi:MAG: PQQ-binding-like beta-propeller repeat protein [Pirellulales bacterium]|nr:PQQ-binding-like beta-propeller repeat protein [Pirellulales bacterium]
MTFFRWSPSILPGQPRCRRLLIPIWGWLLAWGIGWSTGVWGSDVCAAPLRTPASNDADSEEFVDNVFLLPDRNTLRNFSQAKKLIDQGHYSEAVLRLGEILNQPEDFFFQPKRNQPGHRSLKAEAQRLIGAMPAAGRRQYEQQYGARAQQMLAAAAASGDTAGLAEVARRFFHTRAGYEATFLMGLDHLEHGRPLAGALLLKRMLDFPDAAADFEPALSLSLATCWLRADAPEKAKAALVDFERRYSGREILIAGKKTPLFRDGSEAVAWLRRQVGESGTAALQKIERWALHRGDPQRNAAAPGGAPLLNLRWFIPVSDDPRLDEALRRLGQWESEQGTAKLPSLHPLAVDDVVLMRTFHNLLAVDFVTGKRLWEVPVDGPAEQADADLFLSQPNQRSAFASQIQWAVQRLCNDTVYGTLSSRERLVFSVETEPENYRLAAYQMRLHGVRRNRRLRSEGAYNWLVAYDLHTGKRRWHVGGRLADQHGLQLPETYFLGPPLPLMDRLYVVAEAEGEIRLLVLEPESGRQIWSQQLAMVDDDLQADPLRRLVAATPSYGDGILVCPTSTGALVAIDLATRSLLWGFQYGRDNRGARYAPAFAGPVFINQIASSPSAMMWTDPAVVIAEGRVLVTPIEANALYCLNLADGELQWKEPRQGDDLYLACVHRGNVVLAGRRHVRALRLKDGKPVWDGRRVELPEDVLCSGQGFYNGEAYFLPVTSGEVLTLDVDRGKIRSRARSRDGAVPGNLVCYQGRILSQTTEGLSLFSQRDAVQSEVRKRLAQNPNDAEALRLRGEILWDGRKRGDAIECFRRSYALQPDPYTRKLLRESLLEGLQKEFAAYRRDIREIESLLDKPSQKASFLRLMADGLAQSGEPWEAFEQILKLAELQKDRLPMERLSKTLSVRRDRWVQSRLTSLRSEAAPALASQMDAALAARWEAAKARPLPDAAPRFFDYFGNQPAADRVRGEYLALLQKAGHLREAEWNLWLTPPGGDPAVHCDAVAEAAAMYRQADRPEAAAAAYRWLLHRFPETPCIGGITPRQFVENLKTDDPLRRQIDPPDPWPTGKVEAASRSRRNSNTSRYGSYPLPVEGSPGPFFADVNLMLDPNRCTLICTDQFGRELWNLVLTDPRQSRYSTFFHRGFLEARAWGHLLLLSAGGQVLVLDALGSGKNVPPRILWPRSKLPSSEEPVIVDVPWIAQPAVVFPETMTGPAASEAALMTGRYVCFQQTRCLTAADPLTGRTLWQRQGIARGSRLFGDDQYLFVVPPNATDALVLRASDGESLGKRQIESANTTPAERNTALPETYPSSARLRSGKDWITFGRRILRWRYEGNQKQVELFDPWTQQALWTSEKFPAAAQSDLVENETLGVIDPQGKFTLLDLSDGRVLIREALERAPLLEAVDVWRDGQRYYVLAHVRSARRLNQPSHPFHRTSEKYISRGFLYALDRTGKPLWPKPVTVEDQYLVGNLPPGLPVIVFACQNYGQRAGNRRRLQLTLLMVDKRTGRVAYRDTVDASPGLFLMSGDAGKKTLDLQLQQRTVTLTFTEQPWPSPESEKETTKKPHALRSLFKALQGTSQRIIESPLEEDE